MTEKRQSKLKPPKKALFEGSSVALVTPFKNGRVDEQKLGELIEFHIQSGTDGIVPCGTTGESATLSYEEHNRVIEATVEMVNGRVWVLAGTGSNSTDEAIALTRHAKAAGADGALMITPYYNKPTQEGLYRHYQAAALAVDLPLVLYNVPGRTSVNLLPQTVARLMEFDNIVAIKEGTGSLQQISDIVHLCGKRLCILSGDDFTAYPTLMVGGRGVISVTANIVPADMAQMVHAALNGDFVAANKLHQKIYPLHGVLFLETNPAPVKTALSLMGKCRDELRLPLCPLSNENLLRLKNVLSDYGLIVSSVHV